MSGFRQFVNTLGTASPVLVFTSQEAIQEYLGQINNIYLIKSTSPWEWASPRWLLYGGQHLFSENRCKRVLTIYIKTTEYLHCIAVFFIQIYKKKMFLEKKSQRSMFRYK